MTHLLIALFACIVALYLVGLLAWAALETPPRWLGRLYYSAFDDRHYR